MRYNCIIVDDEPKAAGLLSDTLGELFPDLQISGVFTSWQPALAALRSGRNDILFLDVSMPGKNGIDLLRLMPDIDSEIIFVTAHSEYAIDAIKFRTSGYVLKPFEDQELVFAVNKAIKRVEMRRASGWSGDERGNTKLGIPGEGGVRYTNIADILFAEAKKTGTSIVLREEELESKFSIEQLEQILSGLSFFRVHTSFLVNLDYVKRYETTGIVVMDNGAEVPLSRDFRDDFLLIFDTVTKNRE